MPVEFFAGFYPGLGTALSIAGIRYFISWCKAIDVRHAMDTKHLSLWQETSPDVITQRNEN